MEPRQLKDKAHEALAKGRFDRAAELFEEYCALEPLDFQSRLRLGDTWAQAGEHARAISAYEAAAEGFAREGLLPRAIATGKRLLALEPSHQGVQRMLASLYSVGPAPVPASPPGPSSAESPEPALEADSLLHAVELAARTWASHQEEPPSREEAAPPSSLPRIPLFSELPRDAFIALFERCPLRHYPEGARILEQGSQGNAFYVICSGRVRIVREAASGPRELAVLGEGAFFGEMALLSGAPRSASAVSASEDTQVLEISAPVLADVSRLYPQVARALRRFCRQRLLSEVMNTSALFRPFGRKDRRALVERFRARDVRRGDLLIREGQPVDGLYVVLSGEVAVNKAGQPLASLREGELFGEMSLLHKTPATATVTATRNTSLLRLPREDFDLLILTHPQVLALVSELTDARQRSNEARLGADSSSSSPEFSEELILF
ncbi:cyclic nucleotide-binding domain-containing protein [Melittangium boletus]|uniref:PKA regulatory subunit-like protein n=1 Tax=Melittangium boletus DSM 14713 TaxID=1294270 RepID=A0A250IQD7_9BACT|nr:cyclic nucleotide-binding domain-containing protein [Melittangium boletus]ATB33954.1 PKA regulatory subunit-like protein [Melittangium boletus DSM 14713]